MKYYVSLLAFLAFFSIQTTAQKSSSEKETYEVYAWALANINFKDWNLIEIAQQAPKQPIFYEKETIDTVITPDLFGEIVQVFHYLPITPAAHAKAMKKYEKDKRRWSVKTQEGQQKLVCIGGTEYRPFTPTTEFQTIFNELEIESNKVKLPKIKSSKLLAPKGRIHKYIILSQEDSITNNQISRLGFSKVFFNANKTTAIFTFEMYIYHQFSIFKQTSTFLLVKKDGNWRLTTSLVEKKGCPF